MYNELSENPSKQRFIEILDETLDLIKREVELDSSPLWNSILMQLLDVYNLLKNNAIPLDWEEIYDRYDFGVIAVNYFDEEDEIQKRLSDIFYCLVHYSELS